ncbi:NAD(+) diphosphatase [Williamsia deligens]|uniref:NAD(+) diphosphatase n=1 Tax=Williamsia deligens TaxID=321325 RepID=A0ABW3G6B9_9NOCA|nr:NAD(+) diphosphatase [Williamsia deligens]MCP2194844.1 NAD+ diphosphatase [Williamsia deligens]
MAIFEFSEPPLLSRSTIDRADELRGDADRLAAGWPSARVLLVDAEGRSGIGSDGLRWESSATIGDTIPQDAVLIGVRDGVDLWAMRVESVEGKTADPRGSLGRLEPDEAGLLVTALGILNWHASARFSPVDGSPTVPARAGWTRKSTTTGREEFPRTDAAIITVVHDGADHVLLGRQSGWPDRWFSTFAGFVEPGESLEQCVVRELHEETGLDVFEPRYLGSQPWPFPRSLMMGFAARADRDQPLDFLDGEITEAHWFPRDEVLAALESGDEWLRGETDPGAGPRLRLPGSISIARGLVHAWATTPT